MPAPHRIRRQRWSVRAATPGEGLAARKRLRDAWEPALLPAFAAAFDAAAPDGAVVHVPRLEIRLRVDEGDEWIDELPALIRRALAEQLRALMPARAHPGAPATIGGGSAATVEEDARATLLHYLRTGALPWSAEGAPAEEVVAHLRDAARDAWRPAAEALRAGDAPAAAWFRLLHLLAPADAAALADSVAAPLPASWRAALHRLLGEDGDAVLLIPTRDARLRIAAALLASRDASAAAISPSPTAAGRGMDENDDDGEAAIAAVASLLARAGVDAEDVHAFATLVTAIEATSSGSHPPRPARGEAPPAIDRDAAAAGDTTAAVADDAPLPAPPSRVDAIASPGQPETPSTSDASPRDDEGGDEAFPLRVANAGLVLLTPWIPMLFRHLGIAGDGAIAAARLPRAGALLHFLATGRRDVHEFELGMVKVLLGLRPADALPLAEGRLEPGDADEADALLRAVIEHWTALGSTSIAGLRATFLVRGGLLRAVERGWALQVEPAPFDVLLDRLPWGFSLARLPWMTHPVHVEWKTTI